MAGEVEYHFDFGSPNCYPVHKVVRARTEKPAIKHSLPDVEDAIEAAR